MGGPRKTSVVLLLIASGGLFVLVPLLVELVAGDFFLLLPLAFVLLVAAMPMLRRLQLGADGTPGKWGLRLTSLGTVALVLVTVGGEALAEGSAAVDTAVTTLAALSGLAVLGGLLLFGRGMLEAGLLPAGGIWLFTGAMTFAVVTEMAEQSLSGTVPWLADVAPPLGFVVAGLGLLHLGRAAWVVDTAELFT